MCTRNVRPYSRIHNKPYNYITYACSSTHHAAAKLIFQVVAVKLTGVSALASTGFLVASVRAALLLTVATDWSGRNWQTQWGQPERFGFGGEFSCSHDIHFYNCNVYLYIIIMSLFNAKGKTPLLLQQIIVSWRYTFSVSTLLTMPSISTVRCYPAIFLLENGHGWTRGKQQCWTGWWVYDPAWKLLFACEQLCPILIIVMIIAQL